ncbi:putative acetyltransferase [Mycobacteroides abscessus subsp. abscessus]|jgi:RimJ/RimL family protein N-acetyltransferase|nr:putative acetyltransferase [Mycobacteroides abscessus subsp. abscessus]
MDPVILRTERLELRCVTSDDAEAIAEACQDPLIALFTQVPNPYGLPDARWFVNDAKARWEQDDAFSFGFFLRSDDSLAGTCVLMKAPDGVLEIGYWTSPQCRGQGLTVEAIKRLCQWGFADLGVDSIRWCAVIGNDASRAVAVKAGFEIHGTRTITGRGGDAREQWVGLLQNFR